MLNRVLYHPWKMKKRLKPLSNMVAVILLFANGSLQSSVIVPHGNYSTHLKNNLKFKNYKYAICSKLLRYAKLNSLVLY